MSKLEQSLESGIHHKLQGLIGQWQGNTKTWFEPGEPVDESPMKGSIKPMFDGRFLMHEYQGSFQGKDFEGVCIIGYNVASEEFESAWVDSFHMGTGIMYSHGKRGDGPGNNFNARGQYFVKADPPQYWGWRTTIEQPSKDEIILTAYNITPDGDETIATQTIYKRVR